MVWEICQALIQYEGMKRFPETIQRLLDEFSKLPGIGPKSAERFVFYLLRRPREEGEALANVIKTAVAKVKRCTTCFDFSETNPCEYCRDKHRDHTTVCVVAASPDVLAIEKTGEYNGLYHVLGGVLAPTEGMTPEKLRVAELEERVKNNRIREVIIATNPDLEGEATSLYIAKLLKPFGITISRIAKGLPMGSDLEYADEITLANALSGRRRVS